MEFVDKTKLASEAEEIIKSFLKSFIDKKRNYPVDLYDAFSRDKNIEGENYRELLKNILKREQQNRCCYCMRKLDGETLEHIIPDKIIDKDKFDNYIDFNTVLNTTNLCFGNDFVKNHTKEFPPYPHTIAYQNLTLSCCAYNHCNNFRGNKAIKPIILYSTISKDIVYKNNGFVIWKNETEIDNPTIEKLGLNDNTLKMIRRIWLFASKEGVNLLILDKNERYEFIYRLIPEIEENEEEILLKFVNDRQWELLEKYDYFKVKSIAKHLSNMSTKRLKNLTEQIKVLLPSNLTESIAGKK